MHIDARDLPNHSTIEGDICIVGAGAAGISIALDWSKTGKKVILLEGGGFKYESQLQDLYKGESTGQQYYPLHGTRLHYFGGTTGHWSGFCSPFDDIDFTKRDWVPDSGWPISKEDLDPFYIKAQKALQLGPFEYDLSYWQKEIENLNAFPLDKKVVWNKMWQFNRARFGNLYKEEIVNSNTIHLYTYANVVNILANENVSQVKSLEVKNHAGKTHTVKAKQFILASGAIQNARMLLTSNSQVKQGLGNDNDVVGRYFMEHLEISTSELWLLKPFPTDLYKYNGKPRAELAITTEAQLENKILNGTLSLNPLSYSKHLTPRMEILQGDDYKERFENYKKDLVEAGEKAKLENSGSIERAFELDVRIEQAPNPNSRITLSAEKDALGVPRISLHWDLTDLDKNSIRKINQLVGIEAGKANLGRMKLKDFLRDENDNSWPADTNAGWHHMGTTRMNNDPKKGVVNENCQVHGINNLHVAGSGCFTTSGAANPTLTLVALSLRLSDYLKEKII
ncbi:MAG: GMC family oxidoreductase [Cyclobacteriaceae bacterium]|nr:GMC family oxidoreductase [Cyclobacteriaceae bacterium]